MLPQLGHPGDILILINTVSKGIKTNLGENVALHRNILFSYIPKMLIIIYFMLFNGWTFHVAFSQISYSVRCHGCQSAPVCLPPLSIAPALRA